MASSIAEIWKQVRGSFQPRQIIVGGFAATVLLGALVFWADVSAVVDEVQRANTGSVMVAMMMTAFIISSRTVAAAAVYRVVAEKAINQWFYVGYPVVGLFRVFLPGGYITASLVAAYVLSRSLDRRVGPLLLSLAVVEIIHTVVSIIFFVGGFGALVSENRMKSIVPAPDSAITLLVSLGIIFLILVITVYVGRQRLWNLVEQLMDTITEKSPLFARYIEEVNGNRERASSFREMIGQFLGARPSLLMAAGFGVIAQFAVVIALYVSVRSVGGRLSFDAAMASMLPSRLGGLGIFPGGLGGVETAMTGLLLVFTDLERSGAVAATIVYRVTTFWVEAVVGTLAGGVLVVLMIRD